MTSTEDPALARTIPPSEFDIGTPVEWMVDPDQRETILGVTYEFSCGFRQNRTAISLSRGQPFQ